MNLKTWFKGLGVFVLSSFITALATMTLDPASFNFSKAGLAKVGAAALVIGVKAVAKARQAQVAAVEAFAAYAVAKVGKDPAATLQEKQAAVIAYLVQVPTLLNAVRGLMGKSPAGAVRLPVELEDHDLNNSGTV